MCHTDYIDIWANPKDGAAMLAVESQEISVLLPPTATWRRQMKTEQTTEDYCL